MIENLNYTQQCFTLAAVVGPLEAIQIGLTAATQRFPNESFDQTAVRSFLEGHAEDLLTLLFKGSDRSPDLTNRRIEALCLVAGLVGGEIFFIDRAKLLSANPAALMAIPSIEELPKDVKLFLRTRALLYQVATFYTEPLGLNGGADTTKMHGTPVGRAVQQLESVTLVRQSAKLLLDSVEMRARQAMMGIQNC